jgi:hypothetical protein
MATSFTHCKVEIGAVDAKSGPRIREIAEIELSVLRQRSPRPSAPIVWLVGPCSIAGEPVMYVHAFCTDDEAAQLAEVVRGAV